MEFIRINDNMIKCIITEDDMSEFDVSLEDFFTRSEQAMEFLHEVVKLAAEEVDYKPQGPLTSLQIAPMENKSIAIFLTEKPQVDLNTILNGLKKGAGIEIPEDVIDKVKNSTLDEQANFFQKFMENVHEAVEKNLAAGNSVPPRQEDSFAKILDQAIRMSNEKNAKNAKEGQAKNLEVRVFAFDQISDVLAFALMTECDEALQTSLYKDEDHGTYYLIAERNGVKTRELATFYLTACEYGHNVTDKEEHVKFIKEHNTCIIEENAIGKMKNE